MVNANQQEDNPLFQECSSSSSPDNNESMNALFQQFTRFKKMNQKVDPHSANFSHLGDFVGMKISLLNSLKSNQFDKGVWILDTGATVHMCSNTSYMGILKPIDIYTPIFLPDGTIKSASLTGTIELNSRLILKNVLHVPEFKCNLLSVKSLAISAQIIFSFYPTFCILPDLETSKVVARGKIVGNLYVLNNNSLFDHLGNSCKKDDKQMCNVVRDLNNSSLSFVASKIRSFISICIEAYFIHS